MYVVPQLARLFNTVRCRKVDLYKWTTISAITFFFFECKAFRKFGGRYMRILIKLNVFTTFSMCDWSFFYFAFAEKYMASTDKPKTHQKYTHKDIVYYNDILEKT